MRTFSRPVMAPKMWRIRSNRRAAARAFFSPALLSTVKFGVRTSIQDCCAGARCKPATRRAAQPKMRRSMGPSLSVRRRMVARELLQFKRDEIAGGRRRGAVVHGDAHVFPGAGECVRADDDQLAVVARGELQHLLADGDGDGGGVVRAASGAEQLSFGEDDGTRVGSGGLGVVGVVFSIVFTIVFTMRGFGVVAEAGVIFCQLGAGLGAPLRRVV